MASVSDIFSYYRKNLYSVINHLRNENFYEARSIINHLRDISECSLCRREFESLMERIEFMNPGDEEEKELLISDIYSLIDIFNI